MHSIGQINNHRAAQALVDYLNAQGITARREESGDQSVIQVRYPHHVEVAQQHLQDFLHNPNQAKYLAASWEHGDLKSSGAQRAPETAQAGQWWQSFMAKAGWTTKLIALLAIVISLITGFGSNSLLWWFNFDAAKILNGEIYRIISPIFLHFPILGIVFLHLLFNLIWFWDFAGQIEKQLKGWWVFYLVLVIGVFSNTSQWLATQWTESNPERIVFGGLSGVVYGLLGYLWSRPRWDKSFVGNIHPSIFNLLMVWLVLGFTGLLGNVANTAHLAGLLSGIGLAFADVKIKGKIAG